ncbi:MAG: lysylphosphatidylglycerol synthase transmembrane domain-containing protein [Desulfobacterales bacterium]|jgi:hypothetical protein
MKKNITIYLISGITISALALYLAFRNVPVSDLLGYIISINYIWIFPAVLLVLTSFVLRVFRWRIILESSAKVSFWQAFHPLMIGFMINCILPGRVGEVARPAILQKKEKIPFSTGLATVAAERVFDVGMLLILFVILLVTVNIDPNLNMVVGKYHLNRETLITAGGATFKLLIFLVAGIIMISFEKTRKMINRIIMWFPNLFLFSGSELKEKIQKKICEPLVNVVENFTSGFTLVKYPSRICVCIGLSVFIWGIAAFSYYVMAQGCPGIELSFTEITAHMIIICFFIALPSVPGFWGIWEAGGVFALVLFGVSSKDAAGYTLANHAIQMFPVMIVGFVSAMITSVNILQVSYEKREKRL